MVYVYFFYDDVGLLLVEVFFFRACDEISEEKDQKKKNRAAVRALRFIKQNTRIRTYIHT